MSRKTALLLLALLLSGCSTRQPGPQYLMPPSPEAYTPPVLMEEPEPVRPLLPGFWTDSTEYPDLTIRAIWNPVRKLEPGEKADINLKKAQTAQAHVAAGVTFPDEERDRLIADPDGGYSTLAAVDEADDFALDDNGGGDA